MTRDERAAVRRRVAEEFVSRPWSAGSRLRSIEGDAS